MAEAKPQRKDVRCAKCKSPVEVVVPFSRIGNIYGEEWNCPNCGKNIEKIEYKII